ncbi:hypothetical protein A0J57_08790 [Sphingobium sp. 22B]|nr:hypothetical protein AXW74_06285 [Sphingobium sp. AM]KYC32717.1 hypothetical protein A0J57_08790 [Sphingobium sp. 22B]OAP31607.1 hypothetical protein A8O16_12245 [Sphingobium sp. 20006FA]
MRWERKGVDRDPDQQGEGKQDESSLAGQAESAPTPASHQDPPFIARSSCAPIRHRTIPSCSVRPSSARHHPRIAATTDPGPRACDHHGGKFGTLLLPDDPPVFSDHDPLPAKPMIPFFPTG